MRRDFRNEDKSSLQRWLFRLYLLLSFKAWSDFILPLCTERVSFSFSPLTVLENNCSFQTLTFSALFQFGSVKISLLLVIASFFSRFLCRFHFPSCLIFLFLACPLACPVLTVFDSCSRYILALMTFHL